jgi:hypothetical protein
MNLTAKERLELLAELGERMKEKTGAYRQARDEAYAHNAWFIPAFVDKAMDAIVQGYLDRNKLTAWLDQYPEVKKPSRVGIIMAGNIPFVGFHDFLSVFAAGHFALAKLSSRDEVLMKFVFRLMEDIDPRCLSHFEVVERLDRFDAVIATGSNNTSRYFDYYFGKYPNIIRKNRNGTAVLTGEEGPEDLHKLGDDIFDYFGLGCRNVTKLYVPENYNFEPLLADSEERQELFEHHKYRNNYDYNYAVYLLNQEPILITKNLILKEDPSYLSRIACLHYEYYSGSEHLQERLQRDTESIQCLATRDGQLFSLPNEVSFGQTQVPGLFDYADGVDTLSFLTRLS